MYSDQKVFGMVFLVMAIFMLVVVLCEGKGYETPLSCKHFECPSYEVIDTQKEYEIRSYKNAIWMSTPLINSSSYKDATKRGFDILFAYIHGNNQQAAKVDMTAPVLVDINPSNGYGNSSFILYFYLTHKYQNSPPLSDQAHPVTLPRNNKYAAVRRFGGFVDDSNIHPQAIALKQSLKGTPWESAASTTLVPYSVAGYNSPFEQDNRVNEVLFWFEKN